MSFSEILKLALYFINTFDIGTASKLHFIPLSQPSVTKLHLYPNNFPLFLHFSNKIISNTHILCIFPYQFHTNLSITIFLCMHFLQSLLLLSQGKMSKNCVLNLLSDKIFRKRNLICNFSNFCNLNSR